MMKKKYYIETLGCPKNINDSEFASGVLSTNGFQEVDSPEDADFVIVNTCGFIEDAKKESIDRIFEMNDRKKSDAKLIVSGCLAQRYADELAKEIPEASGFIGVEQYANIHEILNQIDDKKINIETCNLDYLERTVRKYQDNPYTSTIKIAEGCNNRCSYCIIPFIRGNYRSKRREDIIEEAKELASLGCKELILIAQDVAYYGKDLYGKYMLPELLKDLVLIDGIQWIRLMYCYDDRITDELIDVIAIEDKICNYIDIPLQHASDKVLKDMHRNSSRESIRNVINKLRKAIPDIAIRTSLIVGFPGETEEYFNELVDMVEETRFARLGVFKYSQEEGTVAGEREDQIPEDVKENRLDLIMRRQMDISLENNKSFIGTNQIVIVDGIDEEGAYIGRTKYDAPEIDNGVIFKSNKKLKPGDMVNVYITDAFDYDLVGIEME